MGDGGSRFDLPKATRFPLQGEGQDGSEEREFLQRLGGFDLPPPNRSPRTRCLVPAFGGAFLSSDSKDALWARFYTGAPQRQRRSVERYSIVKRA